MNTGFANETPQERKCKEHQLLPKVHTYCNLTQTQGATIYLPQYRDVYKIVSSNMKKIIK